MAPPASNGTTRASVAVLTFGRAATRSSADFSISDGHPWRKINALSHEVQPTINDARPQRSPPVKRKAPTHASITGNVSTYTSQPFTAAMACRLCQVRSAPLINEASVHARPGTRAATAIAKPLLSR